MSEENQLIENHIARIIHRLNNPLGAIRIWSMTIQEDNADLLETNADLAEAIEFICDNAETAITILKELRESIHQPLVTLQPTSVKPLLLSAISQVNTPSSIDIKYDFSEEIPNVLASKELVDVFINIITNAIEAMPKGGELEIKTESAPTEDNVFITFTDTGRGMPNYVAGSLFKQFFTTKGENIGHGLGLWWSRAYVVSVGGNLELLWTEMDKGSSFSVSLPAFKQNKD